MVVDQVKSGALSLFTKVKELPPWVLAVGGTAAGFYILHALLGNNLPEDAKGDPGIFFIGNLLDIGDIYKMFEYQKNIARKYGRVSRQKIMGDTAFVISEPEINKRIYSTEIDSFGRGGKTLEVFGDIAGGLILQDNGPEQKEVRKYFDPAFGIPAIKSYTPYVANCTSKLIKWLESQESNARDHKGPGVDIQPSLHGLTFDIIVNILLGFDPNSVETGGHSPHVEAWERGLDHLMSRFPLAITRYWKYYKTPAVRQYEKDLKLLTDLVMDRHDLYMKDGVPEGAVDILAQYVNRVKTDPTSVPTYLKDDRSSLQRHLMTMVFAGHDTTASSVGWTLSFLAMHPEKKERARKEVVEVLKGQPLTYENLLNLPYLEACIKETMRLRPSSVNMNRVAKKDIILEWVDDEGVLRRQGIPKGADCQTTMYASMMDPRNFENPDDFIPERFLNSQYSPFMYFPFGAGPRKCLGEKLALFETRYAVAEVLRNFDYGLIDGHVLDLVQAPTLRIRNGLKVWLKKL
ncbi:hypothetical protein SmJEL517_g02414 [Synchytrium microbalum]|uniref:Cytochrome P450 n=1 Tax=Synchytrium microbalum TaxID=1806994 RepID=A0A507C7G0_9FUNG|nr:uncharacterized protein SmJEL517_g02414 [Synchytrium microbalum]TPX35079.1 hypothetical protein SmJEL517_g02414 [Synchytrium microbalum]